MLDFSQSGQKYEEVLAQLKVKERQLIETTAELDWTKSALKSGEVKDFMARLPGLLMETTEKTLIKQEAAVLNEQHRLRMQQDNAIRHKSPKTSQGIDMQTLLKTTNQSRSAATASKRGHRSVNNDRKLRQAVMEVEPQQLFREESDSKSEGSDDFMTFDQKPARVGGTGAKNSSRDLSNGSSRSKRWSAQYQPSDLQLSQRGSHNPHQQTQAYQVSNRTAYLVRRLLNDHLLEEMKKLKSQHTS